MPVFFPDILYRVTGRGGRRSRAAGGATQAGVPGLRRGHQADRVRARRDLRLGHDGAGRLHGGARRRQGAGAVEPEHPHRSSRRPSRRRSASTSCSTRRGAPPTGRRSATTETLVDFPTLNARSKFWGDDQRAAFKNWEETDDIRNPLDERQGIHERFLLRELLRRVEMKVMQENKLDVVVRLHSSLPPGHDRPGRRSRRPRATRAARAPIGPNGGLTEVLIPAGYVREVYDPVFVLSADKTRYVPTNNNTPTTVPAPGPAVLAGVPGRPGQGGPDPQGRLGLPGRVEAARAAAGVRPARQGARRARPPRRRAREVCSEPPASIGDRSATMVVSGAGVGMVAALAVLAGPAAPSAQVATWRFQLEEATIDDVHRGIKEGQITCQGLVQAYLNRARAYNGVASKVVTEEMAPQYLPDYDQYKAAVAATAALQDGDPKKTPPIEFGRMEPTASDPAVQQQYGMVVGIPNAGQLRAHGHAQRARRAHGDLQGRSRSPSVEGAAAGRVAGRLRGAAQDARRARAGGRARRAVRPQPGPRGDADVLHPVLVQGSVRHQGHAVDRRRRHPLRHRLPGPRPDAGGAAARQGRDHLRQGQHHRVQRPRRQPGRRRTSRPRCCRRRSATSAAPGPATRPTSTTRRAPRRSARARARACRSAPTS